MIKIIIGITLLACSFFSYAFEIYSTGGSIETCFKAPSKEKFTADLGNLLNAKGINAEVIDGGSKNDYLPLLFRRLTESVNSKTKIIIYVSPGGGYRHPEWQQIQYIEKILNFAQENKLATIVVLPEKSLTPDSAFLQKTDALVAKYGAYDYGSYAKNVPLDDKYWKYKWDGKTLMPAASMSNAKKYMSGAACELWAENMLPLVMQVIEERNIQ